MQMLLLGVALAVGQILEKNRVEWMSEAGASLIIGILLGLCVTFANNLDYGYSELFKFNVCHSFLISTSQPAGLSSRGNSFWAVCMLNEPQLCRQTSSSYFYCHLSFLTLDSTWMLDRARLS